MAFDPSNLSSHAATATELGNAHFGSCDRLEREVSAFRAKIEDDLAVGVTNPDLRSRLIKDAAEGLDKQVKAHREKLLSKEAGAFEDRRTRLEKMAADAAAFRRIAPSPRALLETKVHADPTRFAALSAVLHGAPPATLATHLSLFMETPSDHILAAALSRVIDAMNPKLRPVSSRDVADAAIGDTWRALSRAAAGIEYEHQRSVLHENALRIGKPVQAHEKVRIGLLARDAGKTPQAREPEARSRTALDRISDGLEARRKKRADAE